jgi:hypothetical protein
MPTKRPRKKAQLKLSEDEIEEMEALGFEDEEMNLMEQRLATTKWEFESMAKTFRLELSWQPDLLLASGKKTRNTENLTAKFLGHVRPTRDRREAFLIYCSDAFRDGRVWDRNERARDKIEEKYQDFKEMVIKDPDKLERLRADLEAEAPA